MSSDHRIYFSQFLLLSRRTAKSCRHTLPYFCSGCLHSIRLTFLSAFLFPSLILRWWNSTSDFKESALRTRPESTAHAEGTAFVPFR